MAFEGTQGFAGTLPLRTPTPWPVGTYGAAGPVAAASAGGFAGAYGRTLGSEPPGGAATQAVLAPYEQRPEVEARAAVEFTQVASADLIRKLYHYLEANSQRYPQVIDCIPMVRRAAELYGAGDYTGAFSQAYQAHRGITILRSSIPDLPAL